MHRSRTVIAHVGWVLIGVMAGTEALAVTITCIPTSDDEAVLRALRLRGPSSRATALREAVSQPLRSHDEFRRSRVLRLLERAAASYDLEPIADLLLDSASRADVDRRDWPREILDRSRFARARKEDRLALMRLALREGYATFDHGPFGLNWFTVASEVALGGLLELEDDVRQCLLRQADTPDQYHERAGLAMALDLVKGLPPGHRAAAFVADGLNAMPDKDFAVRMNGNPGFRWAVKLWEDHACRTNPFHPSADPECAIYGAIRARQWTLNYPQIQAMLPGGRCGAEHGSCLSGPFEWLERFGDPRDSNFWCW
jgi:hypothetical protein